MTETSAVNTRESLLREWAELAPGECEVKLDSFRVPSLQGGWLFYRPAEVADNFVVRSLILSALIEAVRAREGWILTLENRQEQIFALVVMPVPPYRFHALAGEPCDALLAAYVACLRAIKEGA